MAAGTRAHGGDRYKKHLLQAGNWAPRVYLDLLTHSKAGQHARVSHHCVTVHSSTMTKSLRCQIPVPVYHSL
jgi:hypothetical protein